MKAGSLYRSVSFLTVVCTMLHAQVGRTDPVLLKHWAAPAYWRPQAAAAPGSTPAAPLALVAITPCRVVDTRASQGFPPLLGAPSLVAGASRQFPLSSSAVCLIPAAPAYSLNITVVPSTPGGFITAYPTGQPGQPVPLAATLVWSQGSVTSNAAIVPGGTAGLSGSIDAYASSATDIVIDINGYYGEVGKVGSDPESNTAVGIGALGFNTTGSDNTAFGAGALSANTTGHGNAAFGVALHDNTTGGANTALGDLALQNNTTGSGNIAIGSGAAYFVSGSNSNNIHIASQGASTDNNTVRIGTPGTQTSFFAAGVRGVTTGNNDAIPVVIDSKGQLGTVSSSRRFKEDIQDMGEASRKLLQLRPVTFRYQKPFNDGSTPIQYGLIAEEVAQVFPDLVARSADGQVETVKYQVLDSLLLNEVQRQEAEIRALKERLDKLEFKAK